MHPLSLLERFLNAIVEWLGLNAANITWFVLGQWVFWAIFANIPWREKREVIWKGGLAPLLIPLSMLLCGLLFPYHRRQEPAPFASWLVNALFFLNLPLALYLGRRWQRYRYFIALSLILGLIFSTFAGLIGGGMMAGGWL